MLISELARRVGLSTDTIRFYEKQGLLDEAHYERTPNGYRHYTEAAVQRLSLVKMGQASGFTLTEMRREIRAWETDELTPDQKADYLRKKLVEMDHKIEQLTAMKAYITSKIEQMQTREPDEAQAIPV